MVESLDMVVGGVFGWVVAWVVFLLEVGVGGGLLSHGWMVYYWSGGGNIASSTSGQLVHHPSGVNTR